MALLKVIELLAESEKSWEDAANIAVREASKTLRNIRSVYIKNMNAELRMARLPGTGSTAK
jgi:flavin-binding protein dodecin